MQVGLEFFPGLEGGGLMRKNLVNDIINSVIVKVEVFVELGNFEFMRKVAHPNRNKVNHSRQKCGGAEMMLGSFIHSILNIFIV